MGTGVAAVVAVAVLTDLPQPASRPVEIAGDTTVMQQVNADVGPCSYAVGEALTIVDDLDGHRLTPSEDAQVPGLLRDDQTACSFTDDSIYQLSTIDVPGSAAGKELGQLVGTVTLWATSDALGAIEEIQTLFSEPSDAAARRALARDDAALTSDRRDAEAELASADKILRTSLPSVGLARVPSGAPGGAGA